jgi:hypothetical protein
VNESSGHVMKIDKVIAAFMVRSTFIKPRPSELKCFLGQRRSTPGTDILRPGFKNFTYVNISMRLDVT